MRTRANERNRMCSKQKNEIPARCRAKKNERKQQQPTEGHKATKVDTLARVLQIREQIQI